MVKIGAKKIDLRKVRTQKMIIEAFTKLVAEKGYDAVTVQEIANEAMINRGTFYAHYPDKQALFEEIIYYAVEAFAKVIATDYSVKGNRLQMKQVEETLTSIYCTIKENQTFFLTVTAGGGKETLRKQLATLLTKQYQEIFSHLKILENDLEIPIDFIIEYMTSIFMGTTHWWLTSDNTMTPNQLAKLVIKLVANSHLTVLGIEVEGY